LYNARFPALLFSNGLGDHFLNLPAVRALSGLFPGRLTLVGQSNVSRLFFSKLRLRKICDVPMITACGGRKFDADGVAAAVGPCDLLISLNPWHSPSVDRLLQRLAPRVSVGFFREFEHHVMLNFNKHSAELAFDIPRVFDRSLRLEKFAGPPAFDSRFVLQARRVRRALPADVRVLAVHADTEAPKMWPRQRFIKLLDMFLQRHPDFVAIIVGRSDMRFDRGRQANRIIPCYGLPFVTSALLVGLSDLFVGVDSSMLHAADLFRVPGVGIFGSTSPGEWGFKFGVHRHIRARGKLATLREALVLDALEQVLPGNVSPRRAEFAVHSL